MSYETGQKVWVKCWWHPEGGNKDFEPGEWYPGVVHGHILGVIWVNSVDGNHIRKLAVVRTEEEHVRAMLTT